MCDVKNKIRVTCRCVTQHNFAGYIGKKKSFLLCAIMIKMFFYRRSCVKRQASCDLFAFIFMNDGSIFWRQKLGENQEKKEKQRDRKREKKGKETHNTKKKILFLLL